MANSRAHELRKWLTSNTAAALLTAVLGSGIALFLLPIDLNHWPVLAIIVGATGLSIAFLRRRWLPLTAGGLGLALLAGIAAPLWPAPRDAYVVKCKSVRPCAVTFNVSDSGREATVYPVADPVKAWIWSKLANHVDRLRLVPQGTYANDQIVLHAPLERTLGQLNRRTPDALFADVHISARIGMLTVDLARKPDGRLSPTLQYDRTRRRFLAWTTPMDVNAPGVFSAVGGADDFRALAEEAVRADLQARALTAGDWRLVLASIAKVKDRSLRAQVRDALMEDALLDRSMAGNIFSAQRLIAIRNAMAPLMMLRRNSSIGDALIRASATAHVNTLVFPGGLPMPRNPRHDVDAREASYFDTDTSVLFQLIAEMEESDLSSDTVTARARKEKARWLNETPAGSRPVADPRLAQLLADRGDDLLPFDAKGFGIEAVRRALLATHDRGERDRILYAATLQSRRWLDFASLFMRTSGTGKISGDRAIPMIRSQLALVPPMLEYLGAEAAKSGPTAKEVILSEIHGLEESAAVAGTLATVPDYMRNLTLLYGPEDAGLKSIDLYDEGKGPFPRNAVLDPGSCAWFDPRTRDHFYIQARALIQAATTSQLKLWSAAKPRLWFDYGPQGNCPAFVPGVALLHAALRITSDSRANATRAQLDDLVGADPAWLGILYAGVSRPELFESGSLEARFAQLERGAKAHSNRGGR